MGASNSDIVSFDTPHGDRLSAAGIATSARAGRVRLSLNLYNTSTDVETAAAILRP